MRILITGGTGFLGGAAARRLAGEGHEITVLGRTPTASSDGIRFVRADIRDVAAIREATRDQDAVVHCAAMMQPYGRYEDFYLANVIGTRNVVAACETAGVRRLVNISTPSVYFNYRDRVNIREEEPLPEKPATFYAATKILADAEVAAAQARGLETISLRPRGIIGAGDRIVLPSVLRTAKRGVFFLVGDGSSLVDLTCVENVVDAVVLALHAPREATGLIYNISNGEPMPVRAMVERLFEALNRPVRFRSMPFPLLFTAATITESVCKWTRRKGPSPLSRYSVGLLARSQTLDITRAKERLGYSPTLPLVEGIARFAAWWARAERG